MNPSTQNINPASKVQQASATNKQVQGKKEATLNFSELFSTAMGKGKPDAQLNSIESQLRESLYNNDKQDKSRKNAESTVNAEAAQSAMWAQRNWVHNPAPVQSESTLIQAGSSNAPAKANTPQTAQATETQTQNKAEDARQPAKQEASEKASDSNATEAATASEAEIQPRKPAQPEAGAAAQNTAAASDNTPQTTLNAEQLPDSITVATQTALNTSTQSGQTVEQSAGTPLKNGDPTLANRSTESIDNTVVANNGGNNIPADKPMGNTGNNAGNFAANTVQAQLAPQIAAQAQSNVVTADPEGLKVGQKILATGNLGSTPANNSIAPGLNGLGQAQAGSTPTLIKTPVNQPGFARELGQTVQWAIGKNLSTVDIRVNPESFGPMNMRLIQKGQQVQLVIRTQDEASANLLTQALGGLKEVLSQNGLQLNQVQIQHNTQQQAQGQASQNLFGHNQQGQGQGEGGQHGRGNAHANAGDAATPIAASPEHAGRKPDSALDLFA